MDFSKKELEIIKDCLDDRIYRLKTDIRIYEDCTNPKKYTQEEIVDYLEVEDGWNPRQNYEDHKKEKDICENLSEKIKYEQDVIKAREKLRDLEKNGFPPVSKNYMDTLLSKYGRNKE